MNINVRKRRTITQNTVGNYAFIGPIISAAFIGNAHEKKKFFPNLCDAGLTDGSVSHPASLSPCVKYVKPLVKQFRNTAAIK
jgi:hypothetical protein